MTCMQIDNWTLAAARYNAGPDKIRKDEDETENAYLDGMRSNVGRPSGMIWNGCLSTVKIAIFGAPN